MSDSEEFLSAEEDCETLENFKDNYVSEIPNINKRVSNVLHEKDETLKNKELNDKTLYSINKENQNQCKINSKEESQSKQETIFKISNVENNLSTLQLSSENKCVFNSDVNKKINHDKLLNIIQAGLDETEIQNSTEDIYETVNNKADIREVLMDKHENLTDRKEVELSKGKPEKQQFIHEETFKNLKLKPNLNLNEISDVKYNKETKDNWHLDDWEKNNYEFTEIKTIDENGWDDFGDDEWINTNEINKNQKIDIIDSCENPQKNNNSVVYQDNLNSFHMLPQSPEANASWNGWRPWGGVMTSLITSATEGVTSLTTHVSHVLESSIGIPEPEELVKINQKLEEKLQKSKLEDLNVNKLDDKPSALVGIVSGVTSIGNRVITGGLDTLEEIGKKTMNILQENDPLLLNKRRIIGLENPKPNLSQVLREAKEKSEEIEKNLKQAQKNCYKKQLHFETLFDHYYGLVHLEALEMLSKQCYIKIQSLMTPLSGRALEEMKETLLEVEELCQLNDFESDDHDELEPYTTETLDNDLNSAIKDLGIATDFSEIIECWQKNLNFLNEKNEDSQEVFEKGLRCLAETCALQMNKMHKIAELLIIQESHSTVNEADSLVQITIIFTKHLKGIANSFGTKMNTFAQTEEVKSSITNIFLEVYNSTCYVQSAFKLFIPILQVGAA